MHNWSQAKILHSILTQQLQLKEVEIWHYEYTTKIKIDINMSL